MKKWNYIAILLLFLGMSQPALATVTAWLNQNQINPGESVQLILQHEGQTDSQPDLTPLTKDFEIIRRSSGSNIEISNGKMNAQVQLYLTLAPKHQGKLLVPALQWDGQASPALTLAVSSNSDDAPAAGKSPSKMSSHIFIISTFGQNSTYVQSAVPLKVRIYTDQALYRAKIDLHSNNELIIEQLDQDKQSSETRNGRQYQVIERTYLLTPQRSGRIQLDGPVLTVYIQVTNRNQPFQNTPMFGDIFGQNPFSGMLNPSQPISIKGESVSLNVRPRPSGKQARDWLPARRLTLKESWQPDKEQIRVGDPITLHIHLSAEGLSATQLPDLSQYMQLPVGLRIYPEQPRLGTSVQGTSVISTREQDVAIIASNPGRYKIPEIRLFWWDTDKDVQQEIYLPARTLDVLPNANGIVI